MRSFNTAGPVKPDKHYCIPPLERIDLDEVLRLVRDEQYFVLHAPRQTGKTSALLALAEVLTGRGYRCVYATVETARTARDDVQRAMRTVLATLASQARATLDDGGLDDIWPDILARVGPDLALGVALERWTQASPGPLVLLIDEIDTLVGDSLLSVLQQLRAGYPGRPERFPHSVVLCGMRDLRDYRMGAAGSPFNIAAESLRLGDFSREQTLALLAQHTEQTGQAFAPEALEAVWTQTRGQPWLVNALAHRTCFKNRALREDRSRTVTADHIAAVREELIVNRVTHLDYLADKLREDRVRRVIEPMLSGTHRHTFTDRDVGYARDLGLLARDAPLRVANPIYAEVLPRELAWVVQETLELSPPRYVRSGRQPGRGVADGGVPELLPPPLGALEEPLRLRGGVAAVAPAGVPAARGERRRPHRAGVRAGEWQGGPADRVAAGRPGAGVRGGVQGGARARRAGARGGRGRGADGALRGPLRGGGGALGRDRPAGEPELGGEDLPLYQPFTENCWGCERAVDRLRQTVQDADSGLRTHADDAHTAHSTQHTALLLVRATGTLPPHRVPQSRK